VSKTEAVHDPIPELFTKQYKSPYDSYYSDNDYSPKEIEEKRIRVNSNPVRKKI
jgi:hypothetical protein